MSTPSQLQPRRSSGVFPILLAAASLFAIPASANAQGATDAAADAVANAVVRKGFVINLGLGVGRVSTSIPGGLSVSGSGVATDFKIGYAPNDRLLLYYSNDAVFEGRDNSDDVSVTGLTGIGATYFLSPGENSFYVDGAIGSSTVGSISSEGGFGAGESGFGVSAGGGYEFARHWMLDGDVILGRFDDFNTTTFRVGLMWFYY